MWWCLCFEEAIRLAKNGDASGPEHIPFDGAASGRASADSGLSIAEGLGVDVGRFT